LKKFKRKLPNFDAKNRHTPRWNAHYGRIASVSSISGRKITGRDLQNLALLLDFKLYQSVWEGTAYS
jgi:hypothetical protein